MKLNDLLEAKIKPIVEGLGCQLWGLQSLSQGERTLLRIYVDKTGGVPVEDCQTISRQLGAFFDIEEPVAGAYILEVSSPGMDRILFTERQYEQYVGQKVHIRLRGGPKAGARQLRGQLVSLDQSLHRIEIQVSETAPTVSLALDEIQQTRIVPEWH